MKLKLHAIPILFMSDTLRGMPSFFGPLRVTYPIIFRNFADFLVLNWEIRKNVLTLHSERPNHPTNDGETFNIMERWVSG